MFFLNLKETFISKQQSVAGHVFICRKQTQEVNSCFIMWCIDIKILTGTAGSNRVSCKKMFKRHLGARNGSASKRVKLRIDSVSFATLDFGSRW